MGVAERREKEKLALQSQILAAARQLFLHKGIEHTTMRNIAQAVDYSVGTVYLYFKDKNAIFHALHAQGFTELARTMHELPLLNSPLKRLEGLGKAYIDFAIANPDMYTLMFSLPAPIAYLDEMQAKDWNEGKATFAMLLQTVEACIEAGYFKGHKAEPLAYMFWGSVHGMCSLHLSNRANGVNLKQPDTILENAYAELVKMMEG